MDVTIVIKTFERKKALVRLLKSIEKKYPNLPIIIVDDSKKNYKEYIMKRFSKLKIDYIVESYDIGLSKGRNILIKNVRTKYFLLCDDDFEFDERTNIEYALEKINDGTVDIIGGSVYNRIEIDSIYSILWTFKDISRIKKVIQKEEFISVYNGNYEIANGSIKLIVNREAKEYDSKDFYKTEICSNFFLANTECVKKIGGWMPELLKVGEHEFFFLNAKNNDLRIIYSPKFGVRHYPKKTFKYLKFRMKAEQYFKKACELNNIESFVVIDKNKKQIIYEYYKYKN